MPTAMSGFEEFYLRHGTATQDARKLMAEALHVWRARAKAEVGALSKASPRSPSLRA
jgi:hypothetical protein